MNATFDNSSIIMPVARCEEFAIRAIEHNLHNSPCKILVLYDEKKPENYILDNRITYLKNENGRHFPKILNQLIKSCPTENVLYCSWKARPSLQNYELILEKLNEKFGLVDLASPLFLMGFNKYLIHKIGLFDERYVGGHCVDWDIVYNMYYHDIAHYCVNHCEVDYSLATQNNPTYTTWNGDCGNRENYIKFDIKWKNQNKILNRVMKEKNYSDRKLFKDFEAISYLPYSKSIIEMPWVKEKLNLSS